MVSDKAWLASCLWAVVLAGRYLYLTIVWARFATESRINTSRLFNIAMQLWSMPLALLAGVASYHTSRHFLGLRLPPLDLANGPTKWDDMEARALLLLFTALGTALGTVLWLNVLNPIARGITSCWSHCFCRRCCNDKYLFRDAKVSLRDPYSMELRPANFFNTNIPLVLISQLVCRGDPDRQIACLPKAVRERGSLVLKEVQRKLKKMSMKREQDYLVYGSDDQRAKNPDGVPYYSRPGCCIEGDMAPWGSTVTGVISNENGWLKVWGQKGQKFLPFFGEGERVLVQERKLLEGEARALAAFGEEQKEEPLSARNFGQMPPTATATGLDDDVRESLSEEATLKLAKQMEDLLDKRISQNAAKVLHPFVLGKEYQQPKSPDVGSSNGSDFLRNFGIRAPWNQTRGIVERLLINWEQFLVPCCCLAFVAILLVSAAWLWREIGGLDGARDTLLHSNGQA